MSEVYWISGMDGEAAGQHSNMIAALHTLLWRANIRPAWIDEIHWQSDRPAPASIHDELALAGFAEDTPVFQWPCLPHLQHALVHTRIRSLMLNDSQMVAIGQQQNEHLSAVVLASPAAVERCNLLQHARLAARLAAAPRDRGGILAAMAAQLIKVGYDPAQVEWLAFSNTPDAEDIYADSSPFPGAAWLAMRDVNAGALARLNGMVQALEESGAAAGLLVSAVPGSPALGTLIEKL